MIKRSLTGCFWKSLKWLTFAWYYVSNEEYWRWKKEERKRRTWRKRGQVLRQQRLASPPCLDVSRSDHSAFSVAKRSWLFENPVDVSEWHVLVQVSNLLWRGSWTWNKQGSTSRRSLCFHLACAKLEMICPSILPWFFLPLQQCSGDQSQHGSWTINLLSLFFCFAGLPDSCAKSSKRLSACSGSGWYNTNTASCSGKTEITVKDVHLLGCREKR